MADVNQNTYKKRLFGNNIGISFPGAPVIPPSYSTQMKGVQSTAFWGDQSEVNPYGFSAGIPQLMTDGTYQSPSQSLLGNNMNMNNLQSWGVTVNGNKPVEIPEPKTEQDIPEFDPGVQQQAAFPAGVGNSMGMFASILGTSIGNQKSGQGSVGNTWRGIGAGLGLASGIMSQGLELFRTGSASSAIAQRNNWVQKEAQKKLANARLGQTKNAANGGQILNNETRIVPIVGASGEFIAPKKGEANVEVELGESIQIPGDPVVKEALGERHENGGTPTNVPDGTKVLSDRRKLTDRQAADIRDRFGVKVTPKMTYAEAQSKYKQKIGLADALDEMQKLTDELEKNNKNVKDANTARLNESVLSGRMTEVQKTIDTLSEQDSQFFDLLFDYQQDTKKKELEDYYFGEGGVVDKAEFQESIKRFGLTEEEAKEYWLNKAMNNEFAIGGRYMEFVPVYNKFRTENETYGKEGYQPQVGGTYGRVSEWGEEAIAEMARLFPELTRGKNKVINITDGKASWVDPSNMTANAKAIENVVNGAYGGLNALSDSIVNYQDIRNNLMYDFSDKSQVGPTPQNATGYAHNERTGEGKLGEYHMSRSLGGLRVVTPEQLAKLNEAGIRNYTDLLANESEGRKILGDDFSKLSELRNREGASGLDFIIMDYAPGMDPIAPSAPDLSIQFEPDLSPLGRKSEATKIPAPTPDVDDKQKEKKQRVGRTAAGMPWLFGSDASLPAPSPIDPSYLNQVRMMRAEPVLRSADQTLAAIDQTTNAQISGLNDLADSQRAAYTSFIGAQANEAKARAVSEIDAFNAEQRNRASEINEQRYLQTEQINAQLREQYEDKILQNKAASEDAWFSYWQNMRDQQLVNDEAKIKAAVLSNIYPDVGLFGNYTGQTNFSAGQNVKAVQQRAQEEIDAINNAKIKKGSSSSTSTKKE